MPGYTEVPSYREPLMFDGGEQAAVEKAGCEDANKCCMCFPIDTGLKVVAGMSWCNTVSMFILAFVMSAGAAAAGSISDSVKNAETNGYHVSSSDSNTSAADAIKHAEGDAKDTMTGFLIVSIVSAVLQMIASILMSMWCCCGSADQAKSSKHMYHGTIAQFLAFAVFTVAWFLMPIIVWPALIGTAVDLLWYGYIIMVAKRFHAQMQVGVKAAEAVVEDAAAEAAV
jgi:hypothetical protein